MRVDDNSQSSSYSSGFVDGTSQPRCVPISDSQINQEGEISGGPALRPTPTKQGKQDPPAKATVIITLTTKKK